MRGGATSDLPATLVALGFLRAAEELKCAWDYAVYKRDDWTGPLLGSYAAGSQNDS